MQREELIQKIKNLLKLSTDPSTTEHERNLAYKRAQVLMAKYCITNIDTENISEQVIMKIWETKQNLPVYLRSCINFVSIFDSTAMNFGCYLAFRSETNQVSIHGFKTNIEILEYIFDTLINQGMFDFKVQYRQNREIGFGAAFWTGFGKGLDLRFKRENLDQSAIVLYDKVKEVFEKKIRYVTAEVGTSTAQGFNAGQKSATDAQLNPAISTSSGRMLK